jgi:hypothetical protein
LINVVGGLTDPQITIRFVAGQSNSSLHVRMCPPGFLRQGGLFHTSVTTCTTRIVADGIVALTRSAIVRALASSSRITRLCG